jgi:hypothetical protein
VIAARRVIRPAASSGVTVEATSTALIEKSADHTDTNGQYRLTNLPVGTYSVTFTLSGFTPSGTTTLPCPVASPRQ